VWRIGANVDVLYFWIGVVGFGGLVSLFTINSFSINYIKHQLSNVVMVKKLFGTDGIRGKANVYPMTAEIALKLGQAAAKYFTSGKNRNGNNKKKPKIIIGKDTRRSNYIFEYALASGLCSMGVNVYLVGPIPTPAVAHLIKSFAADAGIVVSASHNPAGDNGIKFFDKNGYKLADGVEEEIEGLVFDGVKPDIPVEKMGRAYKIEDARGRYIEFAKHSIGDSSLNGFKVVLDCAHGAAYKVAPLIFEELGAEVIILNNKPDGLNINKNAGCLHPGKIQKAVVDSKADIGVALDGDADRCILVDEKGNVVDGDHILAIAALRLKEIDRLKNDTLVATVMSNIGLDVAMKKAGINVIKTKVGDRYVMEEMQKSDYILGGEQSGHIIFGKHTTTGDGTITALQMLMIMKKTEKKLSELASCMDSYPQVLINCEVSEKKDIDGMVGVVEKIGEIEKKLGSEGRVLVRYSGTENICRVMIEGKNQDKIDKYAKDIVAEIKREIGV
jgi:phosphoglucosamine mutase